MAKKIIGGVCVFLCVCALLCSCNRSVRSSLSLSVPEPKRTSGSFSSFFLTALNKNARYGRITNPEQSPYLYFEFETETAAALKDFLTSSSYALELQIKAESSAGTKNTFIAAFLYDDDFTASGALKKQLTDRAAVRARIENACDFTLSMGLKEAAVSAGQASSRTQANANPGGTQNAALGQTQTKTQALAVRGFMLYAQVPLKIQNVSIKKARYGWHKENSRLWCGFSHEGGFIPAELLASSSAHAKGFEKTVFSGVPAAKKGERQTLKISLCSNGFDKQAHTMQTNVDNNGRTAAAEGPSAGGHADTALSSDKDSTATAVAKQNTVRFACGGRRITVQRSPANKQELTLDGCFVPNGFNSIEFVSGAQAVCGVTVENTEYEPLKPLTADPGLILDWPQRSWRQNAFELFSWESFPSVLIFDCADYRIQDAFFKRISFYAEKKGYAGTLVPDTKMSGMHGFNAHDYRAETLSSFFAKAEQEGFKLNDFELLLRDILYKNGVIERSAAGIRAGNGAVLSISRESPHYLRTLFITHEGLHGIYFTEKQFRQTADAAFDRLDKNSRLFLKRYFELTPSLNYNTADEYLFKNEFMAYTMQQRVENVQNYFIDTLSYRKAVSAAEPELCEYIRASKAASFVSAAHQMSGFLYATWGIKAGKIALVSIE